MSAHDQHDPWASLAESLGATPAKEPDNRPAPPPPPRTAPPKAREPAPARPAAAAGNWDQLASELGIAGSDSTSQPQPRPQVRPVTPPPRETPAAEAPRAVEPRGERRRNEGSRSGERRQERASDDRPIRRLADENTESRGEDGGEPLRETGEGQDEPRRGRRRRGRRGGRGRGGRREGGDRVSAGDTRSDAPRDDAVEGTETHREDRGPRIWDANAAAAAREGGSDDRDTVDRRRGEARRPAAIDREADRDDDGFGEGLEAVEPSADSDRRPAGEGERRDEGDDESRTRRRRRRGRRGGRGRSRSGAESAEGRDRVREGRDEPTARSPGADDDDEPLPTGYGARPPARPTDAARGERGPEHREGDESRGEPRGRRRRRRGRAESESSSTREPGQGRQRSRGGRRRPEGEVRKSSFSRGRRDDFAPVAGRHDEDDEGLDFLGVEEAGHESQRRAAPEDDDILVESGLNTVLDVPSWVEAIGIVIAGNLDARAKSRK